MAISASSSSSLSLSLCFRTTFRRSGHSNVPQLLLLHQPTITVQFSSLSLHLFNKSRSRNPHLTMKAIKREKEENTNQPSIELETESSSKTLESNSESDSVDDGLGTEIQEAMKAKKKKETEDKVSEGSGGDFWSGVVEEIGMIEWPAFGKVLGTTGVVLGVIAGSSVVLLTLNAVLAELSDRVFVGRGVQDFFG